MQLSPEQQKIIEEQKQHCPFCKIVKGEIPSTKVYEDSECIAVLDINPGAKGHTLLVPKEHYPILPLIPQAVQQHLASVASQLSQALKKAMLTNNTEIFIANGAAAGQQSSHFLIHLLPAEQLFILPPGDSEQSKQLVATLRQRFGTPATEQGKTDLTRALAEHPELMKMVIEQPEELIKNMHVAPELQKLFQGVDIMKLSKKLKEQAEKPALAMSDEELRAFVDSKERLKELLTNDPATLEEAASQQPKLQTFFKDTTVAAVRARYLGDKHV
jgi:histidine triad (HIT) family protein